MQGDQDMTLDSEHTAPGTPRTTAAGLEAWLSGVHAEPAAAAEPEPAAVAAAPVEEPVMEIGPVNAAEALALGAFATARKLSGPDGAELTVDPEHNAYHFESTNLKPLAALLQQPADKWIPVYSEALNATRATHAPQSLERLRWYAGLIATPGILSRRLGRGTRCKLTRWPETEREFPKHFRIAKAMLNDAVTVDEITAASGMPQEEVIDYVNASHAAGRLETVAGSPQAATDTAPGATRNNAILAKLRKPLFTR